MIRRLTLLAATLALFVSACSQTPKNLNVPTLEPQFGTANDDYVDDVAFSKTGYLYVGGSDYLRRYDRAGNLLWNRSVSAGIIETDGSGNVFVARSWDGSDLQKFDKNGKLLWSTGTAGIKDLAVDGSGNLYAVAGGRGYITKYTTGGKKVWERWGFPTPQSITVSSAGNLYVVREDGMVAKYGSSGSKFWAKKLLPGNQDFVDDCDDWACYNQYDVDYRVAAGVSDEFIVLGGVFDNWYDGDSNAGIEATLYLHRFDKNGAQKWRKEAAYLSSYEDWYAYEYHTGGWTSFDFDTDTYGNAYLATGDGATAIVKKFTGSGALAWSKGFGTPELDAATGVATYDGNELYVGGITEAGLAHPNLGGTDAFLRRMDKSGNRVWTR